MKIRRSKVGRNDIFVLTVIATVGLMVLFIPIYSVSTKYLYPWNYHPLGVLDDDCSTSCDKHADLHYNIASGKVCFPGRYVALGLGESTLLGAHMIKVAEVRMAGYGIKAIQCSGTDQGSVFGSDTTKLKYSESLHHQSDVGHILFPIPDDPSLCGHSIEVQFNLLFYYPELTSNYEYAWKEKAISGVRTVVVGTQEQRHTLLIAACVFWISEVSIFTVGLVVFAYALTLRLSKKQAVSMKR